MLFIAFCLLAGSSYAWSGYAAIALGVVFFLVKHYISENVTRLVKMFWRVTIFIIYLVIAELYLETRYIGKG